MKLNYFFGLIRRKLYFLIFSLFFLLLSGCGNMTANLNSIFKGPVIQFPEANNPPHIVVGESHPLNPIGGVEPYAYTIVSGGGGFSGSSTFTAPSSPGVVVINVTDSAGNSSLLTIQVVPTLVATASPSVIALNNTSTVVPQGGVAGYSFSVLSGGGVVSSSGVYEPQGFVGVATIRVQDSAGHITTTSVTANSTLQISPMSPAIYTMTTLPFSATGGVAPLSYSILLGAGSIGVSDGLYQASSSAGTATVVVSDALGNSSWTQVTIQQGVSLSPTAVTLAVGNTQVFTAGGGPEPYTFEITSGDGVVGAIMSSTGTSVTTQALSVGTFILRVTDATPRSFDVTVTVNPILISTATYSTISANNTTTISGVNGVPPYSYSKTSGPGSVNSTTGVYTPGEDGFGVILVTDSKGNTSNRSIVVTPRLKILPLAAAVATGESLGLDASGGVSPYVFSLVSGLGSFSGYSYQAPLTPETAVFRVMDSLGNTEQVSIPVVHRPAISDFQITTSVFQNVLYTQNSFSLSFTAANFSKWCIQFRVSASDTCTWNSTPLPTSTLLGDDSKDIKTFYAWVKNDYGMISTAKSSSVFFNSKFPIGASITQDQVASVAVDSDGVVYALEYFFGVLRKFSASGEPLLSFGGRGVTGDGKFNVAQSGIIRHPSGDLYIYDTANRCIKVFNAQGVYKFKFGTSGASPGQLNPLLGAQNGNSIALAADGNILVADTNNHRVQIFTASGDYVSQFGSFGSGDGQFNLPISLAVDSSGNIHVLERGNGRIQKFDGTGAYVSKFGVPGNGDGQLSSFTRGVVVDSLGNIYVSEHPKVQKFNSSGVFLSKLTIDFAAGLAIDVSDNLYVSAGGSVRKYSSAGILQKTFGGVSSEPGYLNRPRDMAADSGGNIYVADSENHRIQKFDSQGNFLFSFGSEGSGNVEFKFPSSVTVDSDGNIHVLDVGNSKIKKFTSTGAFISARSSSMTKRIRSDSFGGIYEVSYNSAISKMDNNGVFVATIGDGMSFYDFSVHENRIYAASTSGISVYDLDGSPLGIDMDVSGIVDTNSITSMLFDGYRLRIAGPGVAQTSLYYHSFYAGDSYLSFEVSSIAGEPSCYPRPSNISSMVKLNGELLILDSYCSRIFKFTGDGLFYLLQ